jgi:Rieske Fe-S protein
MKSTADEQQAVPPDGRPEADQPAWRRDFPIDWPQDHYVARRDFTKFLGLTSLAFLAGQLWIGLKSLFRRRPPAGPRLVARLDELSPGQALVFHYPGVEDACLLLRQSDGELLAYSQKCTHLSCAVVPQLAEGKLHCPCHHGYFELSSGRPLAGPPRRPLPRVTLEVRAGQVYATGVEARTT